MPVYLKYGTIRGDVTEGAHPGWIELASVRWGTGRGTSGGGSAPSVSDVNVTKQTDGASSALFKESLQGQGVDAVIDFVRTDDPGVYLRLRMSGTMISAYTLSGRGDNPIESLTLNFTKIQFENNPGTPPP